jgi:hypothetical protein
MEEKYDCDLEKIELYKDYITSKLDKFSWVKISGFKGITKQFIDVFYDQLDFGELQYKQVWDEEWIEDYYDKINWNIFFIYQHHFDERVLRDYIKEIRRKKFNCINWVKQKLSINFFRDYKDKLPWKVITSQLGKTMTLEFIEEFSDNIDFNILLNLREELVNPEFIEKYRKRIRIEDINKKDIGINDPVLETIGFDKLTSYNWFSIIKNLYEK